MEANRLVVLTDEGGFFGQTRKPWVSMDIGRVCSHVEAEGVTVGRFTFRDVGTRAVDIHDSAVFYAFSQKENTRRYIQDIVLHLSHGSNLLIPSYDLLMCHENKGYQELYRRQRNLPSLPSAYLPSGRDIDGLTVSFPAVVKTVEGSNGRGVFLARDGAGLARIARKIAPSMPLATRLDLVRRRILRRRKRFAEYPSYDNRIDYRQYRDYVTPQRRFVVQEFVPGMSYDYRVLIMGPRHFVTKRHAREGDFRASGAKRFDFDFTPPPSLLDYARAVYERVDAPFLSMDICPHGEGYALFEFQALHFGINVLKKGHGWFARVGGEWRFHPEEGDFEAFMAEALVEYLRRHWPPA